MYNEELLERLALRLAIADGWRIQQYREEKGGMKQVYLKKATDCLEEVDSYLKERKMAFKDVVKTTEEKAEEEVPGPGNIRSDVKTFFQELRRVERMLGIPFPDEISVGEGGELYLCGINIEIPLTEATIYKLRVLSQLRESGGHTLTLTLKLIMRGSNRLNKLRVIVAEHERTLYECEMDQGDRIDCTGFYEAEEAFRYIGAAGVPEGFHDVKEAFFDKVGAVNRLHKRMMQGSKRLLSGGWKRYQKDGSSHIEWELVCNKVFFRVRLAPTEVSSSTYIIKGFSRLGKSTLVVLPPEEISLHRMYRDLENPESPIDILARKLIEKTQEELLEIKANLRERLLEITPPTT